MPMLTLELPWPPSANRIWRNWQGRTVLARSARQFRKDGIFLVQLTMLANGVRTLTCPVSVMLDLHPPTKRKVDTDNRLKPTLDLLQHAGLLADDAQVEHIEMTRKEVRRGGCVIVTITWEEPA